MKLEDEECLPIFLNYVQFLGGFQALYSSCYSQSPQIPGKEVGRAMTVVERGRGSKVPPSLSILRTKSRG